MKIAARKEFTGPTSVVEAMQFCREGIRRGHGEHDIYASGGWGIGETDNVATLHGAKCHNPLTRRDSITIDGCSRYVRFYALASSTLVVTYTVEGEVIA